MPDRVAIIGGGVAGLSCAMHLAQRGGIEIVVYERDHPGAGSSGLTVGNVHVLYEGRGEIALRIEALHLFASFGEEIGFARDSGVRAVYTPADRERLERAAETYAELGIEARVLSAAELKAEFPYFFADDLEAVVTVGGDWAAHVDGHLLCGAYQARAEAAGAVVRGRTPVIGIETKSGPKFVVVTAGSSEEFDIVINAAGPWAGQVAGMLGVPDTILPQRARVCMVKVAAPVTPTMPQFLDSFGYVDNGAGLYIDPREEDLMVAGIHRHYEPEAVVAEPDSLNRSIEAEYIEALAELLAHRFPTLTDMGLRAGWVGLYPVSPDSKMQVGPYAEHPGVYAACGLGGAGIQLSPMVGKATAEWLLDGFSTSLDDAASYLPDRDSLVAL